MKEEYISIAEFAKRAGVSRQAIYSRLNGELSSFCKLDNGKKRLNVNGLALFDVKTVKKELTPFDVLSQELENKNKQIDLLIEENRKLTEQLRELSDKVGNTLQAITQTQLADKMIEGKKLVEEQRQSEVADQSEPKKRFLRWRK